MSDPITNLKNASDTLQFNDVMAIIDALYDFTPTGFSNGEVRNEARQNNGSCKIFSFAQLNAFSESETLALFGEYYRGVLDTPADDDHQNIRNFIKTGWDGIAFDAVALTEK
jgi:hypothetical protein